MYTWTEIVWQIVRRQALSFVFELESNSSNMTAESVIRSTYLHAQRIATARNIPREALNATEPTIQLTLQSSAFARETAFVLEETAHSRCNLSFLKRKDTVAIHHFEEHRYFLIVRWCWLWLTIGNVNCVVNIA